ncbi:DUF3109 family protein [Marinilabilia rubra]|uniref:DUF3109 domain-containing protein n=1 Tax=Marinilabilia rubra TaxID=2162893 RepID=A0A2U2B872_9BACT|nr:DUF3109 family protein [Marinilabilia rubra]PWD99255.1 DUF3109 domain-containing protein [Marinilabilia rubra]
MVQIDDKIISLDIFQKQFLCDLPKCLGSCCVEGESGAPLEDEEIKIIEGLYPKIKHLLSPEAVEVIEQNGTWETDTDGDKVTPIIHGRECVYTYFDGDGVCKCAIEKAHDEGLVDFKKPVSCHLYPVRVDKYPAYEALNYHVWPVCNPARELGKQIGLPIFRFLKEPIIRKYGEVFYSELEDVAMHLEKQESEKSGELK